jgi:tRNA A37 threonylcarbamoyladenosine biosynthesis protein TsaE
MTQIYTATAKQNPGRQAWLVEFRHPRRMDSSDRPGKKTRKGLGTPDVERAQYLVKQLNELLANEALWSLGARGEAEKLYEPEVIEIFYSELEPRTPDARPLRDKLLPLPQRKDGYAKVVMLGVPGAGKTTLVRQLIGTHPKREAFPSTSLNRTTTFPTELVLRPGHYDAVVTFMSEHETRFEVEECVSAAIVEAVEGEVTLVARTFLEKSDMRFRLKYLLGDLDEQGDEADPYADEGAEDVLPDGDEMSQVAPVDRQRNVAKVQEYIDRIFSIANKCKAVVESEHGQLAQMLPADRAAALDLIEEQADASEEFLALVSDILDELRTKFESVSMVGKFDKTTTGWPRAWLMKATPDERSSLIAALRFFSGISDRSWGRLLTPLVNGMRVQGPFQAAWASTEPRLVLMDTEGLGHKANSTADLPEQTAALLHEVDVILLVDSAKNGLTNYAAGKALESIAHSGLTRKLAMVFTHMDMASESGLKGQRLYDQVFSGLRNVVDNQLSKSLTPESARFLLERLEDHTYYVGRIDKAEAKGAEPELNQLLSHLMAEQPPVIKPVSVPQYNSAFLMMAVQEAARDFRRQWQGILGIAHDSEYKPKSWQCIKALSRRYAENWGENFELRPTANLRTTLETAVSRFLEGPIEWTGDPTPEQKRDAIERLKTAVTKQLPDLARRRLREQPQASWHDAWVPRGTGSTITRRIRIEGIYQRWVPIPESRGDKAVVDFMNEMEQVVNVALQEFETQVKAEAQNGSTTEP